VRDKDSQARWRDPTSQVTKSNFVLKLEKRGKNKIKNTLRAGLSINGGMGGERGQECWRG